MLLERICAKRMKIDITNSRDCSVNVRFYARFKLFADQTSTLKMGMTYRI
jgi:hypothetical protein